MPIFIPASKARTLQRSYRSMGGAGRGVVTNTPGRILLGKANAIDGNAESNK